MPIYKNSLNEMPKLLFKHILIKSIKNQPKLPYA
jgi:hypothetical protein